MKCRGCIFSVFLLLVMAAVPARCDTVYLKNGRKIQAQSAREENGRVHIETENGAYSLPASLVERIEAGAFVPPAAASGRATEGEKAKTPDTLPAPAAIEVPTDAPVRHDGELDRDALERAGARALLTEADRRSVGRLFLAATGFELKRGHLESALELCSKGLSAVPRDSQLLLTCGFLLVKRGQRQLGRDYLMRLTDVAPDMPDAWTFLGYAEYQMDRTDDAIRDWRKSLDLKDDAQVRALLAKAERETAAEAQYEQTGTGHFTLRFEGRQVGAPFGRAILDELENAYNQIGGQLDDWPREPIPVILYTNQAFRKVTRAPSWAGAINDGRIRVPIEGLTVMTPDFAAILKHETVHSFVWQAAAGRCPAWLNEGLAQLLGEGLSVRSIARAGDIWKKQAVISLGELHGSFTQLGDDAAGIAYVEALAVTEFLSSNYGMGEISAVLDRLRNGSTGEAAIQAVYRMSYQELEQATGAWVNR